MYHIFFIHSPVEGTFLLLSCLWYYKACCYKHGGALILLVICFYLNVCPGVGLQDYVSSIFSFWRNFHTVLKSSSSIYIPTNSIRGFPSIHTLSHIYCFCFFFFLTIAVLTGVRWYIIVVLMCISLSNVEHLFMCFMAIGMYSLEKCLLRSSAHFLIGLFVFMTLSSMDDL